MNNIHFPYSETDDTAGSPIHPESKCAAPTVSSASEDFLVQSQRPIHVTLYLTARSIDPQICTVPGSENDSNPFRHILYMRRSSLGSGKGRLGLSGPAPAVCFFSSALGLYVPSICLFFLITHSSSSRARLSKDSTLDTNTGAVCEISPCNIMLIRGLPGEFKQGSGPLHLESEARRMFLLKNVARASLNK